MKNNDIVDLGFDLRQLLDKSEEDAIALAKANGKAVRVVARDGKSLVVHADSRPQRVNLTIIDGVVSSYTLG